MKTKQLFTALMAVLILAISACKTSPKDALSRKWKPTDASGTRITPEIKKAITADGNTIEFTKEGTYSSRSNGKEDDKGTYTVSEDGKSLTTKSTATNREETITVKELTKDKFVGEMQGMAITFEPAK